MEEEKKEETPQAQVDTGNLLVQGRAIVAEMKAENERREALIKREEELKTREMLSGQAEAGQTAPVVDEETKLKEDIKSWIGKAGLSPF